MSARRNNRRSERGFLTVEMLVATVFSMIFLAFLLNLLFVQYGRSIVRTAADEGARAGSQIIADAVELCEERLTEAVTDGLGGFADSPEYKCEVTPEQQVRAEVRVTIKAWLPAPLGQDFELVGVAHSVKEGL